ncbi:MAG: hypothetical protein J5755_01160 [Clostridia bacterium]|nr:hypothetical protein [Clostridia bacterium]
MTEDKAYETHRVTVEFEPEVRLVDSNTYAAEARTLPEGYRDHLEDVLYGRCQAMTESEYEDAVRYSATPTEEITPTIEPTIPVTAIAAAQETTVRVFNRRYLPAVIAFGLTVLAVVLTLLFTVPGTAWEKESIIVKAGSLSYTTEVAHAQTAPVNTIYVDGETQQVELEPYAKPTNEHTNWFDKLCDWLNGVVGG